MDLTIWKLKRLTVGKGEILGPLRISALSGAGEANLGDVNPSHLSAKMANTISESNRLQKAYLPKKLAVVRKVDEARLRGREKNKLAKKVTAGTVLHSYVSGVEIVYPYMYRCRHIFV